MTKLKNYLSCHYVSIKYSNGIFHWLAIHVTMFSNVKIIFLEVVQLSFVWIKFYCSVKLSAGDVRKITATCNVKLYTYSQSDFIFCTSVVFCKTLTTDFRFCKNNTYSIFSKIDIHLATFLFEAVLVFVKHLVLRKHQKINDVLQYTFVHILF